jgi:metal-responsive CopG/Arc/MetJ family transcriptional regulator
MTGVRLPADLAQRLNAWIERQPEPKPTRAEAIRRLMERGLAERD